MSEERNHAELQAVLAEDEEILRVILAEALECAGFEVHQADNGVNALAIIQTRPTTDLLVSDIKMPGMNGFQLAEAGLKCQPGMKVILMTGHTPEETPPSLRRYGFKVMQKPFDLDQLSTLARTLVGTLRPH